MKQTTIFVLLVLLLALTADGVKLWKKLSTTTSTKYIVPTTITTTLTVASTCYSPVNVTGGCRRKRDKPTIIDMDEEMPVLFDIDHILPSPPSHRIEVTPLLVRDAAPEIAIESSSSFIEEPRFWSTLNSSNTVANPGFGVTYVSLITSTLTATNVITVTSGSRQFYISGCLPTHFPYTLCPNSTSTTTHNP